MGMGNSPRDPHKSHNQSEPVELMVENGDFKLGSCAIFISSTAD